MNALEERGYATAAMILSRDEVDRLREELNRLAPSTAHSGGVRSLGAKSDAILALAAEGLPAALAKEALGGAARPVKITGFDKTPGSNWKVPWHQDLTIAVKEARDVEGFGP